MKTMSERTVRQFQSVLSVVVVSLVAFNAGSTSRAQCPAEPPLQNHTGAGTTTCPCFVPGEEAGAIFTLPASEYPIEILKVGIGWGSTFGGQPDSLEQAFHIYAGGLPNPGTPIFSQAGPVLVDGVINLFDVEPIPGEIIVNSGPFMVTLEFLNQNSGGSPFTPSVVHDGNGCQPGKNSVFAIPGGWFDACLLGVTGDWVFTVEYRKLDCSASGPGSIPDGHTVPGTALVVDRGSGGALDLIWSASCSATDDDYSIYEGTIGSFYNHLPKACTTSGSTMATLAPALGDTYYLVVPRDDSNEGSYGSDSSGTERPAAIATCRPPQVASCP